MVRDYTLKNKNFVDDMRNLHLINSRSAGRGQRNSFPQTPRQGVEIPQLALPDSDHFPTQLTKLTFYVHVTFDVGSKLRFPKCHP